MKQLHLSKTFINIFCLFILTREDLINNPIKISDNPNPIIVQSQTKYYIYTSGESIIVNKENGEIESRNAFCTYTKPFVFCRDESNNAFIYSNNGYHKIIFPSECSTLSLPNIYFPNNQNFIGYIQESEYSGPTTAEELLAGHRCQIESNEIIIYGKRDSNYIMFSFISRKYSDKFSIYANSEDQISCKCIDNSEYVCGVVYNSNVYLYIVVFVRSVPILNTCELDNINNYIIGTFNNHTQVEIYDTTQKNMKIICAKNKSNMNIECIYALFEINETKGALKWKYSLDTLPVSVIFLSYPSDSSNNGDCVFTTFSSEILFCCGGTDLIKCARIDGNNNIINTFNINMEGTNTYLTISNSGSNYLTFFFMNSLDSDQKIYLYYLYTPDCTNLNYTIIMKHSINEDKEGNEESLNNFFTRVTNTEYYIEFENIPEEYGDFTLNNELINTNKIIINENDSNIIDFNSTNYNSVNNYEILYTISINETYSTQCKITLTILPCYISCDRCSKDNSLSNSEEHNCIEDKCKEGYYKDPTKSTNCFMIEEKKSNWYFDYIEMKFGICDESCVTCDGGTNKDCLSCYSPDEKPELAYLYKKECIDSCPEGTYEKSTSSGYYECLPCYVNCKSCTDGGNSINMNCDSCEEKNIRYNKNCYKEYDSKTKSFYKPQSSDITNCFELIDYYIEENTYECVSSMPSYGYFLSNPTTGLFSPCHTDCKTCSMNYTETNSNCQICNNQNYNFFDGNCIESCLDGYYSFESSSSINKKTCKECYNRCLTCNEGSTIISGKLANMNCLACKKEVDPNDSNNLIEKYILVEGNCFPIITYTNEKIIFNISEINSEEIVKTCLDYGKSIKYGEYQCITKPSNTYYILNNEENTGVVDYCDEACNSCNGKKDMINDNTNCIECSEQYYKTEDSDTNCILESLIPENYYKNINDNIYYHCYTNCQKCSDYFNVETNNMNCDECINHYYFLYGTKNCYNMDFIENNEYYFSSDDNQFHKCYYSCKKCLIGGTDDNAQNCIKCIDNYYFEENTRNCHNITFIEKGYYFDNFTINEGELPIFRKCYDNCKTCTNKKIENEMNCILCIDNYYKIKGTNNCYNEDLLNNGYYFQDNLFFPCEEKCLTCSDKKTIIDGKESNNCLSCDKINKGLYLVNEQKNCESIDFKENGYYLEEDSNGIEIFYKCYDSCSLCDKGKEFDINTNQDNHNCLSCAENYYRLKNDSNPKNCYGNEMIDKGFILVRNYWQICHENCESCTEKATYNQYRVLISQNCITCYGDLHFIYETSNCADDSILEKGYYFDDNDLKYHKCDIQCKSCDKYSTENDPKCLSCNLNGGYYPAINKPTTHCYNESTIEPEYTLKREYDQESGELSIMWMICYKTCKSCSEFGNEEEHYCISCISRHSLIYNTTNCVDEDYAKANNYYFNTTYGKYVKCDKACNTCDGGLHTNCIKCNEEGEYYNIEGKGTQSCYNSETVGEGYFLNKFNVPYKWNECFEYCATCNYKGNSNKMSCLSCKKNIISPIYNKAVYFKFSNGNCIEGCPNNLFLTKFGDCVELCPNETYQFIPNISCVDHCPPNYEVNEDRTRCISTIFSETISSEEFKDMIFKNLSNFVDPDTVINGSNFKAQIISSDDLDPLEQIKNGISGLDLGNCIEILKKQYTIPNEEDLIIVEIETKEDKEKNQNLDKDKDCIDLGKNVQVSICDRTGRKLDMSFCDQDIKVMKLISDLEDLDISAAMEYAELGIDVFNAKDGFFNDICHPSQGDTDIVLGDRREDLYQNVSFCGDDCVYMGMNFELMTANCACNPNNIQMEDDSSLDTEENEKGVTLNDLANSFTSELFTFNFVVVKCYNLVFDPLVIKKNIGFSLLISMNCLQVIFLTFMAIKRLKPIRKYMLVFEPFDPRLDPANPAPKKRPNNSNIIESENANLYELIETFPDNKNNLSKKEKEIQKSILINNLLRNAKSPKKEAINHSKSNKLNSINDNDDALVVHYLNHNGNSSASSYDKDNNKIDRNSSYKSSESESERYKKKLRRTLNKNNGFKNKLFNLGLIDDDDLYSNIKNSLTGKKNKEKKIHLRNRKKLYRSHSKEKIIFNNKDIQSKQSTILSTIISPNRENFTTAESVETPLPIKHPKLNKKSLKKSKFKSPETKRKQKEIILERKEEYEDYIDKNNNSKYFNNENIFESIKIDVEKRINLKNINKKIKFPIRQRLSSQLKSSDILIKSDNDEEDNKNRSNLKNYLSSKKRGMRNLKNKEKESEMEPKNKNKMKYKEIKNHYSSKSVIIITPNEDKKDLESHKAKKSKNQSNTGNMRLRDKKVELAFTNEELRDMNFEQALHYDNRSFFRIYLAILIEEHIILNTFFTDTYLELRAIKLSFLIFSFEINFFLNAFFYTDQYISDTYHNNGALDFFSSLPKAIYSFLVTLIVENLLKMLSNSKKELMKIIKERKDKQEYLELMENELKKLQKKLTIYFIIVFILGLFFFYYASAFCAVYTNSQKFWFYGCLESFALDLSTPFIICIVLSGLRYLGLKNHTKCLYNTSRIIGNII